MKTLAERFKESLELPENIKNGKNIAYLAKAAGISQQNLYDIKKGINKNPNDKILQILSDELGVDFAYLKYGDLKELNLRDHNMFSHLPEDIQETLSKPENAPYAVALKMMIDSDINKWTNSNWELVRMAINAGLEKQKNQEILNTNK